MPIADPEKSRTYQREYKRLARAGSCQTPGQTQVPAEFRLQTASDVLAMLGEQSEAVLNDAELGTVERARTIGYLAGTLLKAIELGNLAGRLEALEAALKTRSAH
jgi:hypothetical protein